MMEDPHGIMYSIESRIRIAKQYIHCNELCLKECNNDIQAISLMDALLLAQNNLKKLEKKRLLLRKEVIN